MNPPPGVSDFPRRPELDAALDAGIIRGVETDAFLLQPNDDPIGRFDIDDRVIIISAVKWQTYSPVQREFTILHEIGHAIDFYIDNQISDALPPSQRKPAVERAADCYAHAMLGTHTEATIVKLQQLLDEHGIPDPLIPVVESK